MNNYHLDISSNEALSLVIHASNVNNANFNKIANKILCNEEFKKESLLSKMSFNTQNINSLVLLFLKNNRPDFAVQLMDSPFINQWMEQQIQTSISTNKLEDFLGYIDSELINYHRNSFKKRYEDKVGKQNYEHIKNIIDITARSFIHLNSSKPDLMNTFWKKEFEQSKNNKYKIILPAWINLFDNYPEFIIQNDFINIFQLQKINGQNFQPVCIDMFDWTDNIFNQVVRAPEFKKCINLKNKGLEKLSSIFINGENGGRNLKYIARLNTLMTVSCFDEHFSEKPQDIKNLLQVVQKFFKAQYKPEKKQLLMDMNDFLSTFIDIIKENKLSLANDALLDCLGFLASQDIDAKVVARNLTLQYQLPEKKESNKKIKL